MDPVARLASVVVERHDLTPPVDIRSLVEAFATLEYCAWPQACDGIAILSDAKPRVFVKAHQAPRRERFTLAHELGHVVIPWHVNAVDCKPTATQDMPSSETFLGVHHEAEANDFASRVLVPDRFLKPFATAYVPPPEVLHTLEQADVSAAAGVLAARRALLPGYVFVVPDLRRPARSDGTHHYGGHTELRKAAISSGIRAHQGKQVHWYQLAAAVEPDNRIHTRTEAKEILRQLAESPTGRHVGDNLVQRIAGVIGNAKPGFEGLDQATWLGLLHYRFAAKTDLTPLTQHSDFHAYLSFKAGELASTRS